MGAIEYLSRRGWANDERVGVRRRLAHARRKVGGACNHDIDYAFESAGQKRDGAVTHHAAFGKVTTKATLWIENRLMVCAGALPLFSPGGRKQACGGVEKIGASAAS
jgi:hypothetical protein